MARTEISDDARLVSDLLVETLRMRERLGYGTDVNWMEIVTDLVRGVGEAPVDDRDDEGFEEAMIHIAAICVTAASKSRADRRRTR